MSLQDKLNEAVKTAMREKKTLERVLDKLNQMNARLNLDTLPSSHQLHE